MTSGSQLERSLLETKERDELQTIAQALSLKTSARASKATLIGAILDAAGVDAAEAGAPEPAAGTPATNGSARTATARTKTMPSCRRRRAAQLRPPSRRRRPSPSRPTAASTPRADHAQGGGAPYDPANRRNNRRRRGRDRERGPGGDRDLQGSQDQAYAGELVEVRGLLDLRDEGYGFVRTQGYLPSTRDVYVSISQAKRFSLRKGDTIEGACRPAASNEKYPALLRIDSVSGLDPEEAKVRRRFEDLTPLFPDERLRLETVGEKENMTSRIVDLLSPIGKGQRGLIVSPPKAGKTAILKRIAHSIEENNPEVHLMVLLVEERPEEVTDMRRSVKGEVVASTFDRPSEEHTQVAELRHRAREAAGRGRQGRRDPARRHHEARPRLQPVPAGHGPDHVRWRRLRRALPAPQVLRRGAQHRGGRLAHHPRHGPRRDRLQDGRGHLRGVQGHGQHGAALGPPPRGAARLPGHRREREPTRHEELLFEKGQLQQVWKLRRVLNGLQSDGTGAAGLELLMDKIRTTKSNDDFLAEIAKGPSANV